MVLCCYQQFSSAQQIQVGGGVVISRKKIPRVAHKQGQGHPNKGNRIICIVPIKTPPGWVRSLLFGEAVPGHILRWLMLERPPLGALGEGELFGIARDAIPAMPEDQPCSPWQAGDVLGAPRGAGCRGTICLHPWASLPLQKFNNEKRQKKENRKTRHFCASSSPATGSSFMCIYQQCCFMSSSPTGIIFF